MGRIHDPLRDWDKSGLQDEIDLFYVLIDGVKNRIDTERHGAERFIKNKVAEILFIRSFNNEDLVHLYNNFSYYAKKCGCYKEEADLVEMIYREILNNFWYYKEYEHRMD